MISPESRKTGTRLVNIKIADCFEAYNYILLHHKVLGIDSNNIGFAGDSAGGHFACVTTAVNLNEDMQKDFSVEYIGYDFRGVAAICPAVDLLSPNFLMKFLVAGFIG